MEDELPKPKPLFEKRVVVVKDGFVLVGNNVDQIKSILDGVSASPGLELAQAEDYIAVSDALAELAGTEAPSFRHFGRLDLTLQTNYEMLRTGRMPQSKTLLARSSIELTRLRMPKRTLSANSTLTVPRCLSNTMSILPNTLDRPGWLLIPWTKAG